MGRIDKILALFLTLIIAISCLTLLISQPANAQLITKPSEPEFTLRYVDDSYDIPATYKIDPYTGENVTASSGYHVESRKIEVTVKNQPFTPHLDSSGNYTSLYYIFKYKGFYEDEWRYYPTDPFQGSSPPTSPFDGDSRSWSYINASTSDYTIILLPKQLKDVSAGGKIDVQIQALIGHDNVIKWGTGRISYTGYYFVGSTSDWSKTQTITIPDESVSPPMSNPSPTVPEFPFVAVLSLFVVIPLITVLVKKRKFLKVYN